MQQTENLDVQLNYVPYRLRHRSNTRTKHNKQISYQRDYSRRKKMGNNPESVWKILQKRREREMRLEKEEEERVMEMNSNVELFCQYSQRKIEERDQEKSSLENQAKKREQFKEKTSGKQEGEYCSQLKYQLRNYHKNTLQKDAIDPVITINKEQQQKLSKKDSGVEVDSRMVFDEEQLQELKQIIEGGTTKTEAIQAIKTKVKATQTQTKLYPISKQEVTKLIQAYHLNPVSDKQPQFIQPIKSVEPTVTTLQSQKQCQQFKTSIKEHRLPYKHQYLDEQESRVTKTEQSRSSEAKTVQESMHHDQQTVLPIRQLKDVKMQVGNYGNPKLNKNIKAMKQFNKYSVMQKMDRISNSVSQRQTQSNNPNDEPINNYKTIQQTISNQQQHPSQYKQDNKSADQPTPIHPKPQPKPQPQSNTSQFQKSTRNTNNNSYAQSNTQQSKQGYIYKMQFKKAMAVGCVDIGRKKISQVPKTKEIQTVRENHYINKYVGQQRQLKCNNKNNIDQSLGNVINDQVWANNSNTLNQAYEAQEQTHHQAKIQKNHQTYHLSNNEMNQQQNEQPFHNDHDRQHEQSIHFHRLAQQLEQLQNYPRPQNSPILINQLSPNPSPSQAKMSAISSIRIDQPLQFNQTSKSISQQSWSLQIHKLNPTTPAEHILNNPQQQLSQFSMSQPPNNISISSSYFNNINQEQYQLNESQFNLQAALQQDILPDNIQINDDSNVMQQHANILAGNFNQNMVDISLQDHDQLIRQKQDIYGDKVRESDAVNSGVTNQSQFDEHSVKEFRNHFHPSQALKKYRHAKHNSADFRNKSLKSIRGNSSVSMLNKDWFGCGLRSEQKKSRLSQNLLRFKTRMHP